MKKIIMIAIALAGFQWAQAQEIRKVKIAEVLKMADTSSVPLVINFWASWCAPCIKEIPWFEQAVAAYKAQGVKLVLVSLDFADDYPAGVTDFVKKKGYRSEIAWLDETNAEEFCAKVDPSWDGAIPVTLMVNNKKKYRQFYSTQLQAERFSLELKKLIE